MKMQEVAVGIITDKTGRVLINQRRTGTFMAGQWEFPGGKLEVGEDSLAALTREIGEELGVKVKQAELLLTLMHEYPELAVKLMVYVISDYVGEITNREQQKIKWLRLDELAFQQMLPADLKIIKALKLPDKYFITPPCQGLTELSKVIAYAIDHHDIKMIRLRDKFCSPEEYRKKAQLCLQQFPRIKILLDNDVKLVLELEAAGVHLDSKHLARVNKRPLPINFIIATSCHNRAEINQSQKIAADFAVLSPVQETTSHPNISGIGWDNFNKLAMSAPLPIYALGGMRAEDITKVKQMGGIGIAAISAWLDKNMVAMGGIEPPTPAL